MSVIFFWDVLLFSLVDGSRGDGRLPMRPRMPSCSRPSRTLRRR